MERGKLYFDVKGKIQAQKRKNESTKAKCSVGVTHSSEEVPVRGMERRGYIIQQV